MTGSDSLFATLWDSLWGENSLPGRVLILLIVTLTFRAVRRAQWHLQRLGREQGALTQVMEHLAAWRAGTTAPAATLAPADPTPAAGDLDPFPPPQLDAPVPPPEPTEPTVPGAPVPLASPAAPAEADTLTAGVEPGSAIVARVSAIGRLRAQQVRVNLATLQQLSRAREAAQPGITGAADCASLVMMLGLLGTIIGLAIMVQRIHSALPASAANVSVDSWSTAFSNVAGVLGGVKTAFSASLVGMLGAIVCTSVHRRLRGAQLAFFERLERSTAEELLPAMVPAVSDENLLERVTRQLESSFAHLDAIFQQNRQALAEITGAEEAFSGIVEEIRLITKSESSRDFERVVEQLAGTNRAVVQVAEQLPAIAATMERAQRQSLNHLEAAARQRSAGDGPRPAWLWGGGALALALAILLIWHLFGR